MIGAVRISLEDFNELIAFKENVMDDNNCVIVRYNCISSYAYYTKDKAVKSITERLAECADYEIRLKKELEDEFERVRLLEKDMRTTHRFSVRQFRKWRKRKLNF